MPLDNVEDQLTAGPDTTDTTENHTPDVETNTDGESSTPSEVETKEDAPKSMLEAVLKAAKGETEDDEEVPLPSENQDKPKEEDKPKGEIDPDELTADDLKLVKAKVRKQVNKLLGERKDAQAVNEQLKAAGIIDLATDLPKLKQNADAMATIVNYSRDAGLNSQEVNTGFEIMKAMKQSPAKALELLTPYVQALYQATGEILPADIQKSVDEGRIDEAHARELSRARASANFANGTVENVRTAETARAAEAARQSHVGNLTNAITEWENQWKTSDPDYSLKSNDVLRELKLRLLENNNQLPKTNAELITLANGIKTEVDAKFKKLMPKKRELKPVILSGSGAKTVSAPKSMLDVVRMTATGQK